MSFLLQEPPGQNNNQSGGRSRLSVKNSRNGNTAAWSAVDNNSRIFPGLESKGSNRGKLKLSQQQISGNQIMLQRQKLKTVTTSNAKKQQYRQKERKTQQRQRDSAQQEQENLGDYTMDRSK